MTRLSNCKIKQIIREVERDGKSPFQVAPDFKITVRRIQQIVRAYKRTGIVPKLNPNRRPKTELTPLQKKAIDSAWNETFLSAKLLYIELKNRRGIKIPKNKIYSYLKETGRTIPDPKKQKQRKRCRYERDHSGSLVHSDTHEINAGKSKFCILWLDDASRLILAGGEFETKEEKNSIETFKKAFEEAKKWNVKIRQVNTDHGSEYGAHRENGCGQFAKVAENLDVEIVLSRIRNPQTNGKIERLWQEYERHRWRFKSFDDWKNWYNRRLHGALNLEWAESPLEAFQRKMLPEEMLGLFFQKSGRGL